MAMKVSLVVTVLNEEPTVAALLESIISQTKHPDEVVFVDGGSTDKTCDIIRSYQKIYKNIKLHEFKTTRSEARNIGVEASSGDIVVTTDAGCVAEKHWIKKITEPFSNPKVEMVAGFYEMIGGESSMRRALSVFIGITPDRFDDHFLASARSLAFRKSLWEKVGGFPEGLKDTAEDTMFNYNIIKTGAKIVRVKDAIVYWQLPLTLMEGFKKIHLYAKGDAKSGIWWHPVKRFSTHNLKIAFLYFRYIIALYLLLFVTIYKAFEFPFVLGVIFYMFWAFKKVYCRTNSYKAGLYGVIIQFASDIAVMSGFFMGLISI
jgi:glycosyltransferase involved in cell wall biosynthesis